MTMTVKNFLLISRPLRAGLLIFLLFFAFSSGFAKERENTFPPQAIIIASYRGDVNMVKKLLSAGIDKNTRDTLGATALHAAMFQSNLIVVQLLLDYGFDPNVRAEKNGNTPLHYAVSYNNVGAARLLMQYNANKNIKNFEGLTPLEKARKEKKENMVRLLYR